METTGRFKCAVSAEMTFQTFIAAQDLVIVGKKTKLLTLVLSSPLIWGALHSKSKVRIYTNSTVERERLSFVYGQGQKLSPLLLGELV